eukprot:scaffold1351_cov176-Amphora_coffeaeformis.AAC.32
MTANDNNRDNSNGIAVIGAGLGRTGSLSLTQALDRLGYKSYHFVDFGHARQWASFAQGHTTVDEILNMIVQDGYTATLENPTCDIYQDILRKYPNAKVILTVRDTPQDFETSWKVLFETMGITEQCFSLRFPSFFQWIPLFRQLKATRLFMGTTHLGLQPGELTHGWRDKSDGWLATQYERHNQNVIKHVPAKQLLVFNVKEGWAPLCQFLNKPIPDEPFPHAKVNDSKALKGLKQKFLIVVYAWIPSVVLVAVGGAAWFSRRSGSSTVALARAK